ncbi:MAG TPA: hypothetical protein VLV16_01105 [Gemmatimonadales bacterium]|nr:hypothetical protein [Gemmatimonadales bacterium]
MPAARSPRIRHHRHRCALPSGIILVALASFAVSVHAATVSIPCARHNTLYQESGALSNGSGPTILAGRYLQWQTLNAYELRRALVYFPVSSAVPAGAIITGVDLQLYCSRPAAGPGTPTSLYRVGSNWGSASSDAGDPGDLGASAQTGDATWVNNFYPYSTWPGDYVLHFSTGIPATPLGPVHIGMGGMPGLMGQDVQAWLDNPAANFGWVLLGDESTMTETVNVFTAHPVLVVSYVMPTPVKASTWGRVKTHYR